MLPYGAENESTGGRRQVAVAILFLLAALSAIYLPEDAQQRVAAGLRTTVLRPFITTQRTLAEARIRATEAEVLQLQIDSLTAILSTQRALVHENDALRSLLDLSERVGPTYRATSVLRPGTQGSESMFLLPLGSDDGVVEGMPVVDRHGLVGRVREVRPGSAVGMDWTHPDFRASAMLLDGSAYGIVENRRGAFREEDRLVLTGGAYHEDVAPGTMVLTSGLGGVFPRGIPIGRVDGVAEVEAQWRKSYWVEPLVRPASATHVLVQVDPAQVEDLSGSFLGVAAPAGLDVPSGAAGRDRLQILADSVRLLRAQLQERRDPRPGGGP